MPVAPVNNGINNGMSIHGQPATGGVRRQKYTVRLLYGVKRSMASWLQVANGIESVIRHQIRYYCQLHNPYSQAYVIMPPPLAAVAV